MFSPDLIRRIDLALSCKDTFALVLMPGLAFDREGHRIGYGGGFYDRFLEAHPGLSRVALAFEFQIKAQVPYEAFDICPEKIVTEKRIIGRV